MAFHNSFDGFCVIVAPFKCPERIPLVKAELERLNVSAPTWVEARPIGSPTSSLVDAHVRCLDVAVKNRWRSLVIFEDDVIFRDNFFIRWEEIENGFRSDVWDWAFFYRWHHEPIEEPTPPVCFVPLSHTLCTHAYAVRQVAYQSLRTSFSKLLASGSVADSKLPFDDLKAQGFRIRATSMNLIGQRAGLRSSVSGTLRGSSLEDTFRVKTAGTSTNAFGIVSKVRTLFNHLRRTINL